MKLEQKHIIIISVALVAFGIVVVVYSSVMRILSGEGEARLIPQPSAPVRVAEESPAPSIEDLQGRPSLTQETKKKDPKTLSQVYSQYPVEDTGNNIVSSWAKVSPEEKARVVEQLDKYETQAKEDLKVNSDDKKAKHTLFISQTLKKMCKSNFDYSLLESVPEEQGGMKSRSKK